MLIGLQSGSGDTAIRAIALQDAPEGGTCHPGQGARADLKSDDDGVVVELPGQGAVRGVQLPGSRHWYGIPFAAPPLGALRWRAPQPHVPWAGVRDASQPQPQCMQSSPGWRGTSMSEDCLYLNVFAAPHDANTLRPVMVWIHGGGFNGGDAVQGRGLFNGSHLVASQDVVVVTLDYRLNAFGFLGSAHLRDEDGSTGNFGM